MHVQVRDLALPGLCVVHHRPELEDAESSISRAHANLSEEDWSVRVQLDPRGNEEEQRSKQDEAADRTREIQ